jgi:regulatory protein
MTITSVEKVKGKDMMRVFIDNNYSFTIPSEDYIKNNLYEETEISEEKLSHIRTGVLVRAAREQAVRYLTFKDRSESEMLKKLREAGFDADVAQTAASELKAIGYLDDNRFALKYISERRRTKALSKKALAYELKNKGIDGEIIERALSEFEIDDYEVALREAKRKFGKYDLSDVKTEQKVYRFLLHRGFSYETAGKVIGIMKKS